MAHDARQRDAFKERLEAWAEGIRLGAFDPVDDQTVCGACDFRGFCRHAPADARRA